MNEPHFRYSLQPPDSLPVPSLRVGTVELEDDHLNFFRRDGRGGQDVVEWSVETPPEFQLREVVDFDIGNDEELTAFVTRFGNPAHPIGPARVSAPLAERRIKLPYPPAREELSALQVSLRQVAHGVALLRTMVDHVDAAMSGRSVGEVWQAAGAFELDDLGEMLHDPLLDSAADEAGWTIFADLLNDGLGSIHPTVVLGDEVQALQVPPFEAASVLLFNDLAERLPYSRCADETCGRRFRKQLGRSERGGSRRDARFCCPQHARSQSQRARRRAARASEEREHHGQ